jgi:hypothetical protein
MKLKDVPIESGRIPLDQLNDFMKAHKWSVPFIATSEEYVDSTETVIDGKKETKSAGLKINLWTGKNFQSVYDINKKQIVPKGVLYEDGLMVTQKYSKIAGGMLTANLEKLGYDDTNVLQEKFFDYELSPQRTGFPRLIPQTVNDKKPEKNT